MQPLGPEDPQVIGAYRLLGRLGAGGMGRVYLGRSAGGRTVAVKVVHPQFALDEQFRERFRREVAAVRRVTGDIRPDGRQWTAPVLDADPDAPVPWVATGYVAGPSLTEAVQDGGALPGPTVRALGAGLAEALVAVHALGLVHRDIKPSNVLLALDGPRLIDFGIARASDATAALTETGMSIGSPGYMAPEQILGAEVTGAVDVFSFGAVLAYAATGRPPFPGDNSAGLLYRVVHEPPVLGPELTGPLRALVESCLAKSPEARPPVTALAGVLAPAGGGARELVRTGWLPPAVLEEVGRRAVELLDLEPDGSPPGRTVADDPGYRAPSGARGTARPAAYVPQPPTQPARHPGGRDRQGRNRIVAGAAVAATLAAATAAALTLLPGDGDTPTTAKETAASDTSVPKDFLGTWAGDIRQSDGTPNGTMTAVVTPGTRGAYVVRTTYSALNVLECHSKAKLLSATATELDLEEVSDGTPTLGCTGTAARITFTLADGGRLAYASDDAGGGKPTATLTKNSG
ncbi:serine/threonine-protein kinase [Streptomyces sp. UNOC14_S4]|uniref:serine/threonine-protein kinase n=1 Tax=Streptomyces sp. UNOC14_S4 TaxID=2872340 RepID=UPI001E33254E|nr:serine/threonine-protein kinase [Streptomyces sp. UNOC14_S4]MCC3772912.1 serine/threonine protein kinase [Streptomyces sp. UNOC14_S4]